MQLQQLQTGDNLDIPLEQRFQELQYQFGVLCSWLVSQGFELPDEITPTDL